MVPWILRLTLCFGLYLATSSPLGSLKWRSLHRPGLLRLLVLVLQNGLSEIYNCIIKKYLENAVYSTSLLALARRQGEAGGRVLENILSTLETCCDIR